MRLRKIQSRYLKSSFIIEFVVSLVAGVSAFFWAFLFSSEIQVLDHRNKIRNEYFQSDEKKKSSDVVVVYIPQNEIIRIKKKDGLTPRDYIARLVSKILNANASVVALDYIFEEPEAGDSKLLKVLRKSKKDVCGYQLLSTLTGLAKVETTTLKKYAKACQTGYFNFHKEPFQDQHGIKKIVRYHSAKAADNQSTGEDSETFLGSFDYHVIDRFYRARGQLQKLKQFDKLAGKKYYLNFRSRRLETLFNVYDSPTLLELPDELVSEWFENKIVLIGNAEVGADLHYIPTKKSTGTHGVLIHAVIITNFLNNDFIHKIPDWLRYTFYLIFLTGVVLLSLYLRFSSLLYTFLIMSFSYIFVAYMAFVFFSLWLPVVTVVGLIFLINLVVILTRIAYSEKDNLDASEFLGDSIPETLLKKIGNIKKQSIFEPHKDKVLILAAWSKNLPSPNDYDFKKIIKFLDDYYERIRSTVFQNDGCFNRLPQTGFIGFWPSTYHPGIDLVETVLTCAEALRSDLGHINFKAKQMFQHPDTIFMDIAVVEDEAFVGTFSDEQERPEFTLFSAKIGEVLQIPWTFSEDTTNSILFYKEFSEEVKKYRQIISTDKTLAGREIYELQ